MLEGRDGRGSFLHSLKGMRAVAALSECFDVVHSTFFSFFFSLIKSAILFVRTLLSFSWLHLFWQFQRDEQRGTVSAWGLFGTSLYFKMFCFGSECCQKLLYNPFLWRISWVILSDLTSTRVWKGLVWLGWAWKQEHMEPQPGHTQVGVKPFLGSGNPAPAHSCFSATAQIMQQAHSQLVVVGSLLISLWEIC